MDLSKSHFTDKMEYCMILLLWHKQYHFIPYMELIYIAAI